MTRIIALGDCHFPFADKRALRLCLTLIRRLKPTHVVQIGDLHDLFSYGRFPRSHCVLTPAQEVRMGRDQAAEFWSEIRRAAGRNVICHQLLGNHDERIAKKVMQHLPEFEPFLADVHRQLWTFDGVITQPSEREELILNGVCYLHGYRKHGDHVKHNLMNTVLGHTHLGGVVYFRHGKKTLWELNCGHLADVTSRALSYTKQLRFSRWTHGIGVVDDDGPRFIPL